MYNTYSFADVTGAMTHPTAGYYVFQGQEGLNRISFEYQTENTQHAVAADGTNMVTRRAGRNGRIEIEMQQTSALHEYLLNWSNGINLSADQQDSSQWASAQLAIRVVNTGRAHTCLGVSPLKPMVPAYAAEGGNVVWTLMAAEVYSE